MTAVYRMTGSSLDRVFLCQGSAALPQGHTAPDEHAAKGTVRHAFVCNVAEKMRAGATLEQARESALFDVDPEHVSMCAQIRLPGLPLDPRWFRHEKAYAINVFTGEVRVLGFNINREYEKHGVDPDCEVPLTIDVVGNFDGFVFIGDFKGEHDKTLPPAEKSQQLRAAAYCESVVTGIKAAQVSHFRLKDDGSWWQDGPHALDAMDIASFLAELREAWFGVEGKRALLEKGVVPDTFAGKHCAYCNAKHACQQRVAPLIALGKGLEPREYIGPVEMETAVVALQKVQSLERDAKWAKDKLRQYAADAPIPTDDGKVWGPHPEPRNELLAEMLFEELANIDEGAHVIQALKPVTITRSALEKALRDRVPDVSATVETIWQRVAARKGIVSRIVVECSEYDPRKLAS